MYGNIPRPWLIAFGVLAAVTFTGGAIGDLSGSLDELPYFLNLLSSITGFSSALLFVSLILNRVLERTRRAEAAALEAARLAESKVAASRAVLAALEWLDDWREEVGVTWHTHAEGEGNLLQLAVELREFASRYADTLDRARPGYSPTTFGEDRLLKDLRREFGGALEDLLQNFGLRDASDVIEARAIPRVRALRLERALTAVAATPYSTFSIDVADFSASLVVPTHPRVDIEVVDLFRRMQDLRPLFEKGDVGRLEECARSHRVEQRLSTTIETVFSEASAVSG